MARDKPEGAEAEYCGQSVAGQPDIERIQLELNRLAVYYREIPFIKKVDGHFSDSTGAAVKAYQALFGLPISGNADSLTRKSITYACGVLNKCSENKKKNVCPQESPYKVLLYGDEGEEVLRLQHYLNTVVRRLGESRIKPVNVSGFFDEQTRDSIATFQRFNKLPMSGAADKKTWRLLTESCNAFTTSDSLKKNYPEEALVKGSRGENVVYIQNAAGAVINRLSGRRDLAADGCYGEQTCKAVRELQRLFGLKEDGIVEENTWRAITDEYAMIGLRAEG